MGVLSIPCVLLFAAFCFIPTLPRVNCNEQVHDGVHANSGELNSCQTSALYRRLITPQDEVARATYREASNELPGLQKNSEQKSILASSENPKRTSVLGDSASRASAEDDGKEPLGRKLNRRSLVEFEAETQPSVDSRSSQLSLNSNDKLSPDPQIESSFPLGREENQHASFQPSEQAAASWTSHAERNPYRPSFELSLTGRVGDVAGYRTLRDNQGLANASEVPRHRLFENFRIGLPGQPVRRIVGLLLDRLSKLRPIVEVDQSGARLPRRLLDQGRNVVSSVRENSEFRRMGIHKAVKLGPLSVSVDVGRP